jgi:hypothetical protein
MKNYILLLAITFIPCNNSHMWNKNNSFGGSPKRIIDFLEL